MKRYGSTNSIARVLPPIFIELLADIEKPGRPDRLELVARLANNTPMVHSYVAGNLKDILIGSLLGQPIPMDGRPVVPAGRRGTTGQGFGMIFDLSHEAQAFQRWQKGEFLDVERFHAREWREALAQIDLNALRLMKNGLENPDQLPKSLKEAHQLSNTVVERGGLNILATAINLFAIPARFHRPISERWHDEGARSFFEFAPYAAYCLTLELFFMVSTVKGLLGTRATNRVDISYLHYLPFAQIFVSNDKLHRTVTPFFLRDNQRFIWGEDLKRDLRRLDEHFSAFPEEEKSQGLFRFATKPPADGEFLTAQLWAMFRGPASLDMPDIPVGPKLDQSQAVKKMLADIERLDETAKPVRSPIEVGGADEFESMVIERSIPVRRGKWRIMPPNFKGQL